MKQSLFFFLYAAAVALCLLAIPLACSIGPVTMDAWDALTIVQRYCFGETVERTVAAIGPEGSVMPLDGRTAAMLVGDLRLPRVLLALASGAGLALSGAVFQGILRNPLADPFTLGVSGGAAFGAALVISLGLTAGFMGFALPLAAFAGAAAALGAVLLLGRIGGGLRRETLVLAGVVVSAFLAALIALVKALDESSVTGIVFWIMGSFQGRGWAELFLLAPGVALGSAAAFFLRRELDILSLGDETARHLGVSAAVLRLVLLLAAGAVTASCVAVSGIIGFVGLIVPHLCRLLLGAGHGRLLPACALCGGLLLLASDTAARSLLPGGVELPVGVITALLGGPFFCWMLGKTAGGSPARSPLPERLPARPAASPIFPDPGVDLRNTGQDHGGHRDAPPAVPHIFCDALGFAYAASGARSEAVLEAVSLTLRQGEFVGLLGPNGSGKSTLLRCIAGTLRARSGRVLVMGEDIAALGEKRRARLLATLPQHPESVPALSAFSLCLMGRYAYTPFGGGYGKADEAAVWAALEETAADTLAHRPADTLSGGELQRVLLARSLAQGSPLLLLDEATAGLDPRHQTAVLDCLARRDAATPTVLAVLHDLNLAALYCRRLIFLKKGRVVADGPTRDVFTPDILSAVYETDVTVITHPTAKLPQALLAPRLRL